MNIKEIKIPPEWSGWRFEGNYLIDECGNKYHPLTIKASFFYRQLKEVRKIMYEGPNTIQ